jgi:hypothetical protein
LTPRALVSCAAALAALAWVTGARAEPPPSTTAAIDAEARAAGNHRADAVALGTVLLARRWPAQVLKVRIDGTGGHAVAGIVVSAVKFHERLDPAEFTAEAVALVSAAFAASGVEEVDLWATVPLPVTEEEVSTGDYLRPAAQIVYAATVRRTERSTFAGRLRRGENVFWDPAWRRSLGGT